MLHPSPAIHRETNGKKRAKQPRFTRTRRVLKGDIVCSSFLVVDYDLVAILNLFLFAPPRLFARKPYRQVI